MIHGGNLHPSYSPTSACEALECSRRAFQIDVCREEGCGYRWMREAAQDRAERQRKDADRPAPDACARLREAGSGLKLNEADT